MDSRYWWDIGGGVLVLVAGMRERETKKEKEHGVVKKKWCERRKGETKKKTRGGGDWEEWVNRWGDLYKEENGSV